MASVSDQSTSFCVQGMGTIISTTNYTTIPIFFPACQFRIYREEFFWGRGEEDSMSGIYRKEFSWGGGGDRLYIWPEYIPLIQGWHQRQPEEDSWADNEPNRARVTWSPYAGAIREHVIWWIKSLYLFTYFYLLFHNCPPPTYSLATVLFFYRNTSEILFQK